MRMSPNDSKSNPKSKSILSDDSTSRQIDNCNFLISINSSEIAHVKNNLDDRSSNSLGKPFSTSLTSPSEPTKTNDSNDEVSISGVSTSETKTLSLGPSGLFLLDESKYSLSNITESREEERKDSTKEKEQVKTVRTKPEQNELSISIRLDPDDKMLRPPEKLKRLIQVISKRQASSHRMNACGTLKSLCFVKENRNRFAYTQGVIYCIVNMLDDEASTEIEKIRCVHALMYLCLEESNYEVIMRDENICNKIGTTLLNNFGRIRQITSYCVSLLAKDDLNRHRIAKTKILMEALSNAILYPGPTSDVPVFDIVSKTSSNSNDAISIRKTSTTEGEKIATATRINALIVMFYLSKVRHLAVSNLIFPHHLVDIIL